MDRGDTGYSPLDCKELDTTEAIYHAQCISPWHLLFCLLFPMELPILNISYKLNHIIYGLMSGFLKLA